MNSVLILTIILFVAAFAIGFHRGLFGIVSGLINWAIIIGFLYFVAPPIEKYLMKGGAYTNFRNSVSENVKAGLVKKENKYIDALKKEAEKKTDSIYSDDIEKPRKADIVLSDSQSMKDFLEDLGIKVPIKASDYYSKKINKKTNDAANMTANINASNAKKITAANQTISDAIGTQVATLMVKGIAILISLLIAFIITRILSLVAQILGKVPVIGGFSKVLGGIWGVIVALLILWLFMDIVTCFSTTSLCQKITAQITKNEVLNILYMNNPLLFLINK
ncbi:MAG: hypothetical protein DUD27_02895 [Lachnospiraceae bacterium]|uniref:CvpA family protein n=1 Tax=Candidatus Weimeria bifida TaxID=2599074 RepID=A0A6N7J200_9FIRM|nr:hypothetical protein [Candidatus Weimeria bifida]RRF96863.1 MAG: hypothetical protein DUD27_02895 [Lachnospiraceae bacterium]